MQRIESTLDDVGKVICPQCHREVPVFLSTEVYDNFYNTITYYQAFVRCGCGLHLSSSGYCSNEASAIEKIETMIKEYKSQREGVE